MIPIPGDTYDPCEAYKLLRAARDQVLLGGSTKRIRFKNGEEERETEFSPASLKDLNAALIQARNECQLVLGEGRPIRSAIGVGRISGGPYGRVW